MDKAYAEGVLAGRDYERERIIKKLESYLELSQFSEEAEGAEPNPAWDAGFQAAIALAKGDANDI